MSVYMSHKIITKSYLYKAKIYYIFLKNIDVLIQQIIHILWWKLGRNSCVEFLDNVLHVVVPSYIYSTFIALLFVNTA